MAEYALYCNQTYQYHTYGKETLNTGAQTLHTASWDAMKIKFCFESYPRDAPAIRVRRVKSFHAYFRGEGDRGAFVGLDLSDGKDKLFKQELFGTDNVPLAWRSYEIPTNQLSDALLGIRVKGYSNSAAYGAICHFHTNFSAERPYLIIETEVVTIFSDTHIPALNSTIHKGFSCRFSWKTTYDATNVYGNVAVDYSEFRYRSSGAAMFNSVRVAGNQNHVDFDTNLIASAQGMEWSVQIFSVSGTTTASNWIPINFKSTASRLKDFFPTSRENTYKGLPVTFRWNYDYNMPSGVVGGSLKQVSAKVRWRLRGSATHTERAVSGNTLFLGVDGNTLPLGAVEWQVASTNSSGAETTSEWIEFTNKEVPMKLEGLYPATGSRIIKAHQNRFGWSLVIDEPSLANKVSQTKATLQHRENASGAITSINLTTPNFIVLPAGTFKTNTIEWRVTITTNVGKSIASPWVPLITQDTLSTPTCVSPVGKIIDDKNGIAFQWLHVIATGTAQTAWRLQYSTNAGAHYETFGEAAGTQNNFTVAKGRFAQGTILWRVQTRNSDNAWGAISEPATIILRRAPETPIISYADGRSVPTVRWQSVDQEAYRVTIGSFDTGWLYGTAKEYHHNTVFPNGVYPVTVTVRTMFELESLPATLQMAIENKVGTAIAISATGKKQSAEISWSTAEACKVYYVLRDGLPIAKTTESYFLDDNGCGKHSYVVRGFRADGNYTDSPAIIAWSRVRNAAIRSLQGGPWLALDVKIGGPPTHAHERDFQKSYAFYYGKSLPEEIKTDMLSAQHTFAFTLRTQDDFLALCALQAGSVIYKDCFGNRVIGSMDAITASHAKTIDVSFSITETNFVEEVPYDTI